LTVTFLLPKNKPFHKCSLQLPIRSQGRITRVRLLRVVLQELSTEFCTAESKSEARVAEIDAWVTTLQPRRAAVSAIIEDCKRHLEAWVDERWDMIERTVMRFSNTGP
jgi:hypothetical protein